MRREFRNDESTNRDYLENRAKEQVEFFVYKSLTHFCQSNWTLETYRSGAPFNRDYYPARIFHGIHGKGMEYCFDPRVYNNKEKIGFYADQACRLWEIIIKENIRSFDTEMKRAQLLGLQVPGSILLVDESQDMDACQVDWISRQQVNFGTHVYVVGDPAQAIYGFRGAKPQFLMNLSSDVDKMLTESWRFGNGICRVANLILYAKEKSDQTSRDHNGKHKNWTPYRTRAGITNKVARVTTKSLINDWRSTKVTLIARANATLMLEALGVLGFGIVDDVPEDEGGDLEDVVSDDEDEFEPFPDDVTESDGNSTTIESFPPNLPRIHINGRGEGSGLRLWKKSLKLVESVYRLYRLSKQYPHATTVLDEKMFPDFARKRVSWDTFRNEVTLKDLTKYANVIHIVERCKDYTMKAVNTFQKYVMDHRFSADEANIILTTCHSAKGMEWDNVQVCDDFIDLKTFKKNDTRHPTRSSSLTTVSPAKKPRLVDSWCFAFQSWGDDVNLAYVACTRAKRTLSLPPCVHSLLDVLDNVHDFVVNHNSGNNVALQIPGVKEPLTAEQADSFYNSLVLPLRMEYEILGNEFIKPELVECDPALHGGDVAEVSEETLTGASEDD